MVILAFWEVQILNFEFFTYDFFNELYQHATQARSMANNRGPGFLIFRF